MDGFRRSTPFPHGPFSLESGPHQWDWSPAPCWFARLLTADDNPCSMTIETGPFLGFTETWITSVIRRWISRSGDESLDRFLLLKKWIEI